MLLVMCINVANWYIFPEELSHSRVLLESVLYHGFDFGDELILYW